MNRDATQVETRQRRQPRVDCRRIRDRDAEFVLRLACRNLRVRTGVDVGVDAQRRRRANAARVGEHRQIAALLLTLDVELPDALVQRMRHFGIGLADTRKDDPPRRHSARQRTVELARRHDIGTHAHACEHTHDREIGIGLQRIGDFGVTCLRDRVLKHARMALERCARVDVDRGADLGSDTRKRHVLGVEFAVPIFEMIHPIVLSLSKDQPGGGRSKRSGSRWRESCSSSSVRRGRA